MGWPFKKKSQEDDEVTEPVSAYFSSTTPLVSYWSYFTDRASADEAAEALRALELSADVQASAGVKDSWLMLAYMPLPESEDVVERNSQVVKSVVAAHGGDYDGWEAGPMPDEETLQKIQDWLAAGIGAA